MFEKEYEMNELSDLQFFPRVDFVRDKATLTVSINQIKYVMGDHTQKI